MSAQSVEYTFLYQVKKYLYQIRSHPATREKYDACFAYVHRFYTQRQGALPSSGCMPCRQSCISA